MAEPLSDPIVEDQLRLGERISQATAFAAQQALDVILDAAERKVAILEDQALAQLAREMVRADPTS